MISKTIPQPTADLISIKYLCDDCHEENTVKNINLPSERKGFISVTDICSNCRKKQDIFINFEELDMVVDFPDMNGLVSIF